MKDLYALLGIKENATEKEIRKAYLQQAIRHHPDKTGSQNDHQFKLISEAYHTLSDKEKRRQFDRLREFLNETGIDDQEETQNDYERLTSTDLPYSHTYQEQHRKFIHHFLKGPIPRISARTCFTDFKDSVYPSDAPSTIFEYLKSKNKQTDAVSSSLDTKVALTPKLAIEIFIRFLQGDYFGETQTQLIDYFSQSIEKASGESRSLYKALKNIFSSTGLETPEPLLKAVEQLIKHASAHATLPLHWVHLFQNKYFRHFYQQLLHAYWQDSSLVLDQTLLNHFNAREATQSLIKELRENLTSKMSLLDITGSLKKTIRGLDLLAKFENQMHKQIEKNSSAEDYRETAFSILNWFPALTGQVPTELITNTLLQAALYLQYAAKHENVRAVQMADEKLAQEIYLLCFSISHHSTPALELPTLIHGLKYLSLLNYADETTTQRIKAFQERTLFLANIFPFYQTTKSYLKALQQDEQLLPLMRSHLHNLVSFILKKEIPETFQQDLPDVPILYLAYEGCIKLWYEIPYQKTTQDILRQHLMETLLNEAGFDPESVEENLVFDNTTLQRDEFGYLDPADVFTVTPYENSSSVALFSAVNGLEIDHQNGTVHLLMTQCDENTADCFRVLSAADIQELIHKNIDSAIFSLDPIDPRYRFHPFNTMWFRPTRLYQTGFLQTLLAADYLLKCLTVQQDVQGVYPFTNKSLDQLTQHLPHFLKKIIDNFHNSQRGGSIHRFWIEAEVIPINHIAEGSLETFRFYDAKMGIKKHLIKPDVSGNLLDAEEEREGWFFYFLTTTQMQDLNAGKKSLSEPAMFFLQVGNEVFFREKGEQSQAMLEGEEAENALANLRHYTSTDPEGKIIENSRSLRLIYQMTRFIARQFGKPHYFSPEYIFAQEFSLNYDAFGLYFPEFKRLQELTRLVTLIRALNGVRESAKEAIAELKTKLLEIRAWLDRRPPKHPLEEEYLKQRSIKLDNLKATAATLRADLEYVRLFEIERNNLLEIRFRIGEIFLLPDSDEVKDYCEKLFEHNYALNGYNHAAEIRSRINAEKNKIAEEYSKEKSESFLTQLKELFPFVPPILIDMFLYHNQIDPLAEAVTNHKLKKAKEEIAQSLEISVQAFDNILAGGAAGNIVLEEIATRIVGQQFASVLEQIKEQLHAKINAYEKIDQEINTLGLGMSEEEINLLSCCLWVPANMNHQISITENWARFVYGGVAINPQIIQVRSVGSNANISRVSVNQLVTAARGGATGGTNGGATGGTTGGAAGGSGGGGGGGARPFSAGNAAASSSASSRPLTSGSSAASSSSSSRSYAGGSSAASSSGSSRPLTGATSVSSSGGSRPFAAASATASSSSSRPPAGASGGAIGGSSGGAAGGSSSGGSRPPAGGSGGNGNDGSRPPFTSRKAMLNSQGYQEHHIISTKSEIKNHALIQKAGFDLESRANKIFLPARDDVHPTRSIHWGRHRNEVHTRIENRMDEINQFGISQNWSKDQYNTALRTLLAKERAVLKDGDIALNRLHRPWSTIARRRNSL